jgi:aspartate/methionine/tyrosine aminotransferase
VYSGGTIQGIARLAVQYGFFVVVDELYCRLVYDGTPFTHLACEPGMDTRSVTLLGGSKTESLTGYRIGAVVASAEIVDAIEQVVAFSALRAPAYSQHVLAGWLHNDEGFVRERVRELRSLQRRAAEGLRAIAGVRVEPGAGTAYLWPDVSALGLTSLDAARLIYQAGVVVSPGYQFGPSGKARIRICYAQDEARLDAALDRITAALASAASGARRPRDQAATAGGAPDGLARTDERVQMANEVLKGAIGWRTCEVPAGYQIPQALAVGSEPSGHHLMLQTAAND